jgi:hypothetical protein
MDQGLWISWYDFAAGHTDAYLAWLHGRHLLRVVKRPGVVWAGSRSMDRQGRATPESCATLAAHRSAPVFGLMD